jgi:hypothetical protein
LSTACPLPTTQPRPAASRVSPSLMLVLVLVLVLLNADLLHHQQLEIAQ